ncbi:hypothetical protein V6N12_007762 [Hibiscus sabdariffa]|uniref:Retrotransposon gag domain-containing protein n=1 Tax=Hibiscus sabdariffa TaxID=183260 RepID=A0ABR2F2S2_9ROSI
MSASRQMSFLLISRSFHSELLQYNFLPLVPAAFEFCQGRSVLGRLPEITNKLATNRKGTAIKSSSNHARSQWSKLSRWGRAGTSWAEPTCPTGRAIAPPQNNQQPPARTVRDYLAEDLEGLNPAVTTPEFEAEHFELKPVMFNMLNTLGQFGGSPVENARQHLKSFLEICNSFKIHGVFKDVLKLKLFPYSLTDKARAWLNNLPPGSLQSWTELCRSFLAKFSYNNMTDHLRNQITSFRQEDDEAMHEA